MSITFSDKLDVEYEYDLHDFEKLCTIASIANQIDLNVNTVKYILNVQMKGVKVTARYGIKVGKDQKPKLRLGFTVNNTNEAFVEFLYKGHDITYHLKYQHTITNWTKINTIAKICAVRHYSFEDAEKLLEIVMDAEDEYTEND